MVFPGEFPRRLSEGRDDVNTAQKNQAKERSGRIGGVLKTRHEFKQSAWIELTGVPFPGEVSTHHSPPVVTPAYHISKGVNQLGPCTLDDLRTFLAYGSVSGQDLVRRAHEEVWHPLESLEELRAEEAPPAADLRRRRRTVRYREYEKVPRDSRSGVVLLRLVLGFYFFPPLLWRAAVAVFQRSVVTPRRNVNGYLEVWPRWVEGAVSALVVINAIAWWLLLSWAGAQAEPMVRAIAGTMALGLETVKDWFAAGGPGR